MDSRLDFERDKYLQWKEEQQAAMYEYCHRDCEEHDVNCPFYDPEEESWDFEECFETRGGLE